MSTRAAASSPALASAMSRGSPARASVLASSAATGSSGTTNHSFLYNFGNRWKSIKRCLWQVLVGVFRRHTGKALRGRPADDDAPHHAGMFMRLTIIVINARHRQSDGEGLIGKQIVGVPGFGLVGNAQRALQDCRMIGGCRVGVAGIAIGPADGLARLDEEADGIEPHFRAVGAPLHADVNRSRGEKRGARKDKPCAPSQNHAARNRHFATRASSAWGTCQSTTCACGFSTPGWPALK